MDHLFITQMIEKLNTGRDSVCHMRDLVKQNNHDDQGYSKGLDEHCLVALSAMDHVLSMLHTSEHLSLHDDQFGNSKSQDSAPLTPKRDRRGCYKRRRNVESTVVDTTTLADDGRAWRKYGQKVILNSAYPRNYYRCTHKTDQGCQATKQVQQISDQPTKYRLIYHGHHTCKPNLLKTPSIFIDSTNPKASDSSVYLNFETNTPSPKHGILNLPSFFLSNSSVKQEYGPIKMETTTSEPSDVHHQPYNSSPSSPDPAITTPRSEISSDVYSSVASPHDVDVDMGEEYYRQMMANDHESINLDQVLESFLYDHHYGSS